MKYEYKIIKYGKEIPQNTEWRFVGVIETGLLFEKVIQEPPVTYTLPNSSGTTILPFNPTLN